MVAQILGGKAWISPLHLFVVVVIFSRPFCAALNLILVVLLVFLVTCGTKGEKNEICFAKIWENICIIKIKIIF